MANLLLLFSSYIKGISILLRPEQTIVCDCLSLPGWFIIDGFIIHQTPYIKRGLKGFQWETYEMPDEWRIIINKYKQKEKIKYYKENK